ncbi:MAG: LamG domain-containing protein [Planctomycetaceae bacterium]|jgi:hypothetical protein|nr:LamG domain-containing protein [Planctomycetaceae bacterium]
MRVRNLVQLIAGIFVNQSETSRKSSKPTSKRKLSFEVLEGRELLSANWTGSNFDYTDDYWQDNVSNSYYESNYSSNSDSSNMSFQSNSTTTTDTETIPDPIYSLAQETTFDGSTFYTIGDNSSIGNISGNVTLRAVFNADSVSGWKYLLAHDVENHRGNELFLRIRDGNLQFGYWLGANTGNANILAQMSVEAGKTYDAIGTYDGQNWQLYVNGILRASTSDTNRNIGVNETHNGESFTPVWLLGGHGETADRREFVGTISEAEIYNTALTSAQISELSGPIVKLTGPTGNTTYEELTQDQFDVTITREFDTEVIDTSYDLDFELTISGDASKDDFEIYDGETLISGASDYISWSTDGTVFSYKISTGSESVTLTFKLVDNKTTEDEEESLTITLTSATATVNNVTQDIKIGTDDDTTVTIKNNSYSVKWQTITGTDANKTTLSADPNSGGKRVFPEKSTPTGEIENKFELVFELETAATANTTLYFKIFDPDNFIGLGNNDNDATTWAGGDNYAGQDVMNPISVEIATGQTTAAITVVIYPDGYSGMKLVGDENTIVIDSAHVGDNFIVVVDTDETKVNAAALGTTEDTRYKETNQLTQTELLTVWRTLWMELDQMVTPTATEVDDFAPDLEGIMWDYTAPTDEDTNFDVLIQPAKPDISLLTTAMKAACIEVKEIPQDAAHNSWITGDNGDLTNGGWRTETPFVHNFASNYNEEDENEDTNEDEDYVLAIGDPSRDIANTIEFWCMQGVGAYDADGGNDHDGIGGNSTLGAKTVNDTVFLIFSETIRDIAATQIGVTKTASEIGELSTMHETLHAFSFEDFDHPSYNVLVDGLIMSGPEFVQSTLSNAEIATLSAKQIQKIQSNNKPT